MQIYGNQHQISIMAMISFQLEETLKSLRNIYSSVLAGIGLYRYIVMEPRSTRDIEILFKLIDKVPVVGNTADTPNPLGLLPF